MNEEVGGVAARSTGVIVPAKGQRLRFDLEDARAHGELAQEVAFKGRFVRDHPLVAKAIEARNAQPRGGDNTPFRGNFYHESPIPENHVARRFYFAKSSHFISVKYRATAFRSV